MDGVALVDWTFVNTASVSESLYICVLNYCQDTFISGVHPTGRLWSGLAWQMYLHKKPLILRLSQFFSCKVQEIMAISASPIREDFKYYFADFVRKDFKYEPV